ncbi:MAG: hypothetical protein AABZ55_10510 [Bdellovibrionota bacterium]
MKRLIALFMILILNGNLAWSADSKNEISTQNEEGAVRIRLRPPKKKGQVKAGLGGAAEEMLNSTQNPPQTRKKSKLTMICTPLGGKPVGPGEAGFNECMKDAQQDKNIPYSNPAFPAHGTGIRFSD